MLTTPNLSNNAVESAPPITITIGVARRLSGLGYTTIWKLIGEGTLQTVHVGRRRLILYDSLLRLLTPANNAACAPPRRRRGRPRKPSCAMAEKTCAP
jgi:hypothetical protein